jgi:hypothetical protein
MEHSTHYWTSTDYGPAGSSWAYFFDFVWGDQSAYPKNMNGGFAWAVTDAPRSVPEPSTILLLGTGRVGLVGIARRRKG